LRYTTGRNSENFEIQSLTLSLSIELSDPLWATRRQKVPAEQVKVELKLEKLKHQPKNSRLGCEEEHHNYQIEIPQVTYER